MSNCTNGKIVFSWVTPEIQFPLQVLRTPWLTPLAVTKTHYLAYWKDNSSGGGNATSSNAIEEFKVNVALQAELNP